MEQNEPLKFGHDSDGLSKRRISSILKAPRTSMKAFGADQDENQDETRTIEKRRNSRRVSFATTNNVHVFSKDIKTVSPVQTPIQNLTAVGVCDGHNKKVLHFDTSEIQPITGLDTMLTLSQQNKNFFPDPILQDECVDRTMLHGEDTGYMDMTHSHTITIDKEVGITSELGFSVLENITGLHSLKNDMPSKTTGHVEKDAMRSEFDDFLASISKPGAQNIVASSQIKNVNLFGLEDAATAEIDKENVLPPHFTKQAAHCLVNPQSRGLQRRRSVASFHEQEHMDMTMSHTVVIDKRVVSQYDPYSVCGNHRSAGLTTQSFSNDSDDMEITRSQTATINFKVVENEKYAIPLDVDRKSNFVSDDTSGMVMTQVFDGFLQEQEHKISKDEAIAVFPQARTISSFSHSEDRHISDQNQVDYFQNNLLFATVTDCDEMEITQCQTVVLETKSGREPFGQSRKPSFSMYGNDSVEIAQKVTGHLTLGAIVTAECEERKENVTLGEEKTFSNDQSDMMELTCRANTSVMVMSPSPDDMELTGCNNVTIDSKKILATQEIISSKRTTLLLEPSVSPEARKADCVQSDLSFPNANDDMEMTQCQTVVLESKHCEEHKPFGISRKRLSLMPESYSNDGSSNKGMKMAHELTGHTYSETERCTVPGAQAFFHQELPDCMEVQEVSLCGMSAIQDDMDLTGCKTITIGTKNTCQASASNIPQKAPCVVSSRSAVFGEDEIEMTEVVRKKPEKVQPSQNTDCNAQITAMDVDAGDLVDKHKESYFADMDLTKGLAGLNDPSNCDISCIGKVKESSSLHLTARNPESSEKDFDMEISGAFTMPFEKQCSVDFKQGETAKENTDILSGITDQRAFKEAGAHSLTKNKPTVTSIISEGFSTECEPVVKKDQSKSRRRSLADLQETLQNIAQRIGDGLGSYTAPIANFTVSETSLVDGYSERPSSTEPVKEALPLKNNVSSANDEGTTPFNRKNFLTARLSLGGITPKLPSRTKSASLNQTEPIGTNRCQSLHLETQLDGIIQNSNYVVSRIDNEVLPEEDFSDTVLSYLSNNKDGQDTPLDKGATEDNVGISKSEKMPCEGTGVGDGKRNEASKKLWHNDSGGLEVKNGSSLMTMIEDTCSSSSSTNMKCEGASESTLRNSQIDSQMDGTMYLEFDFNKALEDGNITVNEFLSHFSANSVIHKSRPSAVPDIFGVAQTHTMKDLLKERYLYRPKQRVYEADCQKLAEMTEGFKTRMAEQDKPLREINETLLHDMCAFSNVQIQRFGAKLKERRVYFRKRSKALSHQMKNVLNSELLKTTQESKQNLVTKISEANEMLKDIDGCVNDLESELAAVNKLLMGDQLSLTGAEPALKGKQQDLDAINSKVAETKRQICDLEHQKAALEDTLEKQKDEARELESRITTFNSLNEWRFHKKDENGAVFTFLHNTVHLEIKPKKSAEKEWMHENMEHDVDISFKFLLNGGSSQPHASMIHKLLAESMQGQTKWMQKYATTRYIPMLLHDVSLVVSRLRLLGEEIHRLKKWGGLRLGILNITCVDTIVEIVFSSLKAFVKFELSLAVTPDYPLSPLQMQKFQNHIGNTSVVQIENILSSVAPAKNHLTKVIKRIHADLMG